jgi:hypothetical protein
MTSVGESNHGDGVAGLQKLTGWIAGGRWRLCGITVGRSPNFVHAAPLKVRYLPACGFPVHTNHNTPARAIPLFLYGKSFLFSGP